MIYQQYYCNTKIQSFDLDYKDCTFINCKIDSAWDVFQNCTFIDCTNVTLHEACELQDCTLTNSSTKDWSIGQQCWLFTDGKIKKLKINNPTTTSDIRR